MLGIKDIAAVEERAAAARLTVQELCEIAGVFTSSWSRAKTRGKIRVTMLRKMEHALDEIEAAKAA